MFSRPKFVVLLNNRNGDGALNRDSTFADFELVYFRREFLRSF